MKLFDLFRSYLVNYPNLKQFIKFCVVGGTAAVINFGIYYSFTEALGYWYIYSAVIAFIVSAIYNFTVNKLWTFRNKEKGREILKQVAMFGVVTTSGLIINTTIIYVLTEFIKIDYKLSWVGAGAVIAFWNYTFNRFWTFRNKSEPENPLPLE